MSDLPVARALRREATGPVADRIGLTYEGRFLRRKRLVATDGLSFLVDLARTVSLNDGDAFELEDGRLIAVDAAPEALLEVRGAELARLAWHIGNRHAPCQVEVDRLLIAPDPVLRDMLGRLGAKLRDVTEPFRPEGGAYGEGRTHGHSHHHHGDGHAHSHDHAH